MKYTKNTQPFKDWFPNLNPEKESGWELLHRLGAAKIRGYHTTESGERIALYTAIPSIEWSPETRRKMEVSQAEYDELVLEQASRRPSTHKSGAIPSRSTHCLKAW